MAVFAHNPAVLECFHRLDIDFCSTFFANPKQRSHSFPSSILIFWRSKNDPTHYLSFLGRIRDKNDCGVWKGLRRWQAEK